MNTRPIALALLLLAVPAYAAERFAPATDQPALDQPQGREVGRLRAGGSYPLLKRGGPGGTWCKVELPERAAWVPCEAGRPEPHVPRSQEPDGERPSRPASARCATTCSHAPLFSQPPALSPEDREVLALCPARPDVAVSAGDVRAFVSRHYDDPRIQRALSAAGRPGSGAGVKEANVSWLTGLWVSTGPRNAFTHVFCGDDWGTDKLGGLHFLPRYAQLEQDGKLCYQGPVKGEPQVGAQYLIRYHGVAPWSCGQKKVGGFPVEHDPVQLLALATRAFVRCCERDGQRRQGGVYTAPDLGGQSWRVWCNERNGTYGIASLYPTDERPTCR